jgi:hypothetical protein
LINLSRGFCLVLAITLNFAEDGKYIKFYKKTKLKMSNNSQDEEPMDDVTFKAFLKSKAVPLKLKNTAKELPYDLKFYWRWQNSDGTGSWNQRIYFGNYFRLQQNKVTSMTIGPGTPFKTDTIVVILNPDPKLHPKTFAVKIKSKRAEIDPSYKTEPGFIISPPLMELLYSAAHEVGIKLPAPKKEGDTVVITCDLIPWKPKVGPANQNICILKILD